MASRYHLALAGPVPAVVAEAIRGRFGDVTVRPEGARTILEGPIADQAAMRALLNLLWDTGGDVRLLLVTTA